MNEINYHKKILHKLIPSSDYIPGGEVPFTNDEIQTMLDYTQKPIMETLKPTREECFTEFLKAIETLTISNEY